MALVAACLSAAWAEPAADHPARNSCCSPTPRPAKALPVEFQATVTYFRGYEQTLYVQDGDAAIYVQPAIDVLLTPGDRVLIKGTTHESFRPIVVADNITVLHRGTCLPPCPQPLTS